MAGFTPILLMKTFLKTSVISTFAVFTLVAGLSAKVIGSGNVVSETRSVSGFHGVDLLSSGNVVITQGDTEGLVIEAEDNLIPLIETKVTDNGTLRISFKEHEEIHVTKHMIFHLSVKAMDSLVLSGSGGITSKAMTGDHLAINLRGSGDVSVDHLETGALTVAIDGSGNVKLAGKANSQSVSVSGSGDYEAAALKTSAATVSVPGSGDCDVAASETLGVTISGSGDVSYYGSPTVTKHVTGLGEVESLGAGKK